MDTTNLYIKVQSHQIRLGLHFFDFSLSSPSGITTALLCMQFAESASNIAAGALIKANSLLWYF
jgi:hypothetical protein